MPAACWRRPHGALRRGERWGGFQFHCRVDAFLAVNHSGVFTK